MINTYLQEIELPFNIDAGAPLPEINADEFNLTVSYFLLYSEDRCRLKFLSVLQFTFGSPNEEAINGHRYFKLGLMPYSFYEVHNSEKIEELKNANKVHPYHSNEMFDSFKHFIFPFHDTTLEVVAKSYECLPMN